MLFNVFNNSNNNQQNETPKSTAYKSELGEHSLLLTSELADLRKTVPELVPGTVYDFISHGQWSAAHILIYVLSLTIHVTTKSKTTSSPLTVLVR